MVDGNIILSVAKAMELLQLLSRSKKPLSLKELSAQCGYPKSTVFGLLTTMRTYDVVTQTPDGKYSLGLRLFEYGRQVERSWDISLVARPYMEHLCQQTGASVVLSVCEGGSVVTLDQAETRGGLHIVSAFPLSFNTFQENDIVNIGLHFFLKDVRPMLPPVMNRSIVDA